MVRQNGTNCPPCSERAARKKDRVQVVRQRVEMFFFSNVTSNLVDSCKHNAYSNKSTDISVMFVCPRTLATWPDIYLF